MLQPDQVEEIILRIAALDRQGLIQQFNEYQATFPVDFHPDFLNSQPLDRLRHIFVALCLQCQRPPEDLSHRIPVS